MSDLETNKATALRLVEVFNGQQLEILEDAVMTDSPAIVQQIGLA